MSYAKALVLGLVAGMRSMTAPAIVSHELAANGETLPPGSPVGFLAQPGTATTLQVLAAAEIAADKTPWIPARTAPPGLIGRVVSGALVGTALGSRPGYRPEIGGLVGAAAAVVSTYAAYHLRKRLAEELHVPDVVLAVAEDGLAVGLGTAAMRSGAEPHE